MEGGRCFVYPPSVKDWKYKPGMMVNTGLGALPADLEGLRHYIRQRARGNRAPREMNHASALLPAEGVSAPLLLRVERGFLFRGAVPKG